VEAAGAEDSRGMAAEHSMSGRGLVVAVVWVVSLLLPSPRSQGAAGRLGRVDMEVGAGTSLARIPSSILLFASSAARSHIPARIPFLFTA
jgi:hypothetical protein